MTSPLIAVTDILILRPPIVVQLQRLEAKLDELLQRGERGNSSASRGEAGNGAREGGGGEGGSGNAGKTLATKHESDAARARAEPPADAPRSEGVCHGAGIGSVSMADGSGQGRSAGTAAETPTRRRRESQSPSWRESGAEMPLFNLPLSLLLWFGFLGHSCVMVAHTHTLCARVVFVRATHRLVVVMAMYEWLR